MPKISLSKDDWSLLDGTGDVIHDKQANFEITSSVYDYFGVVIGLQYRLHSVRMQNCGIRSQSLRYCPSPLQTFVRPPKTDAASGDRPMLFTEFYVFF
ncbi:hypothetical protein IQ244_08295 [Nostoc sp. LEGE 06077]|uniref:hypothetical protein n=1 Tax=Nostoc sp. LEGE 06077 TaxID=915325 RepID=UPI001880DC64|nr:hypothetical protein [Nostoc sp. LEGE 06077]MBE9206514.1 hypothetical protein [Nostoc sp. LEGE 06077]